ncbi:MAG TPA: NlpC/P60 family protein [Bacteroidia bacterium]|jgi:lipoprotein Spr|nr:NlpC/P60 family protein [Bacteroidia bacterium]
MKKLFLFLCLALSTLIYSQHDSARADSIIVFAKKHLGIKYRYAECTPKRGFDCSGFVFYVFGHFNIKVPRASMDYEKTGKLIQIDSCKTGDIIVFTGTNSKNKAPGHVGIIVSNTPEGVVFIHSSSGHKRIGVILTNFTQSLYYQKRFIKVARMKAVY